MKELWLQHALSPSLFFLSSFEKAETVAVVGRRLNDAFSDCKDGVRMRVPLICETGSDLTSDSKGHDMYEAMFLRSVTMR